MLPRLITTVLAVALLAALIALPSGDAPSHDAAQSGRRPGPGAVSVAHAQGSLPAIPSSWPTSLRSLQLGRASVPNEATGMMSRAPFGFRYQYLSGGANTGGGWATWNSNGDFVTYYIQDSVANNVTPVFTYYMIYQSAPAGGNEPTAVINNLNNTSTMQAYYADLKLFFQRAGAFPSNNVVFHVEPDMWGYVQQASGNDNGGSVSAKVGSTGVSELSGLPDTVAGLAQGVVRLRNQYAPNVILAYHVSDWGTGTDITLQDPSDSTVDQLGDRAAAFYNSLGASFDLAFSEISDRDSGFKQVKYGMGAEAWWTDADFARHARFIGRFVQGSGKRMVLWQVPLGNTRMLAMNDTNFHFQDNRVEKLLDEPSRARLQTYVNAGVMAFLFGAGEYFATHATNHANDGVTDFTSYKGTSQSSYNSDDDGGFFHNRAAAYYTTGAMSIPGGSESPATATPTATATATATATPTLTPVPGGATPTPVVPPGTFTQTASVSAGSVQAGSSVTITAVYASGSAGAFLTDVEVYSAGSVKLHQQYFDGQSFSAGQHRTYQSTWNIPANTAPGVYTVMLGTFSAGWGTFYAWNSNAATITVVGAGTPTATPTPTPTLTPTSAATVAPTSASTPAPTATATLPPAVCSPRPAINVETTAAGARLRVDLTATGQNNRLLSLQFTQTPNALVDVGGQNGRTGAFSVSLPGTSASTTFYVRRAAAGPTTVMLTVVDRCGSWSTFVGSGPGGGF